MSKTCDIRGVRSIENVYNVFGFIVFLMFRSLIPSKINLQQRIRSQQINGIVTWSLRLREVNKKEKDERVVDACRC